MEIYKKLQELAEKIKVSDKSILTKRERDILEVICGEIDSVDVPILYGKGSIHTYRAYTNTIRSREIANELSNNGWHRKNCISKKAYMTNDVSGVDLYVLVRIHIGLLRRSITDDTTDSISSIRRVQECSYHTMRNISTFIYGVPGASLLENPCTVRSDDNIRYVIISSKLTVSLYIPIAISDIDPNRIA